MVNQNRIVSFNIKCQAKNFFLNEVERTVEMSAVSINIFFSAREHMLSVLAVIAVTLLVMI